MEQSWIDWVVASSLGMFVGIIKLAWKPYLARWRVFCTPYSLLSILLNVSASIAALIAIRFFGVLSSHPGLDAPKEGIEVIVAGLGAPLILRLSTPPITVGTTSLVLSLRLLWGPLFTIADDGIKDYLDRKAYDIVASLMRGVSFAAVYRDLPDLCLSAVGASDEQGKALGKKVNAIRESLSDEAKSILLGLILIKLVREGLFRSIIARYQQQGAAPPGANPAAVTPPTRRKGKTP